MVLQASTSANESANETTVQAIARELLAATRAEGSSANFLSQVRAGLANAQRSLLRPDDMLLAWANSHPGLRVQLFRFIDCLPSLQSNVEIARHFQEYLTGASVELPDTLKQLLNFTKADSVPGKLAAATIAKSVEALAHRYIAGETIPQITKTIETLRRDRMGFTIDLLGEAVITEVEAASYLQSYLDLMRALSDQKPAWTGAENCQVSVKLTAFYSQFDPLDAAGSEEQVCDRLRTLLRRAGELGTAVHFDMEQYEYKDLTLAILQRLLMEEEFRQRRNVGITLQAYLRDSERDLQNLIAWAKQRGTPVTLRLVKGAYWDRETIRAAQHHWQQPVYNQKAATDANFERLTRLLLEHHEYLYGAIGSHNVRSQAVACAVAETLNIPRDRFELQVLYGMGDRLAKALGDRGYRVRVYCPYGKLLPGMAYLIRRLLENTANSSFLRQDTEQRPVEELIAPPAPDPVENGDSPQTPSHGFVSAADSDFAKGELRQQAKEGLAQVRSRLGKTYLPLIAGEYRPTDTTVPSVNPARPSEVVGEIGMASIEQAEAAIQAAKAAFSAWKRTPARDRAAVLNRAADLMEARRYELAGWMVLETGKPLPEADPEISEAIDMCRYYAAEMLRLDAGHDFSVMGETNRYHYQPRGITVVISPWNFPLAIATGMTVASLVAGNCTILKPATVSAAIAAQIASILVEAGVPSGVFQYLPAPGSTVGAYLVEHKDIHTIVFTGSQEVGCRLYAQAATLKPGQKHLKRVIAEMGGKNAIIVDESADLDAAVAGVVKSAFGYAGQKCSACSRAIVLAPLYEAFVERLVEATRSLQVGDPADPGTKVGPVIDAAAKARIEAYIDRGKQEATVALDMNLAGSDRSGKDSWDPQGYFVRPVIFTDVDPNAAIAQEEIFGPVLSVSKANTFSEALDIANGTPYALTGGLYSRTPSHIQQAVEAFEVGNLYINRGITGAVVARHPFGGFKLSGVGSKAGGPDYLLQFLEPRTATENIQRHGFAPIAGAE